MIKKIKNNIVNKIKETNNENGMSTIEVIFLVAVLLSLAILFGVKIKTFAENKLEKITNDKLFEKVDPSTISGSLRYDRSFMCQMDSGEAKETTLNFSRDKLIVITYKEA